MNTALTLATDDHGWFPWFPLIPLFFFGVFFTLFFVFGRRWRRGCSGRSGEAVLGERYAPPCAKLQPTQVADLIHRELGVDLGVRVV